ncbi:MAG TPA: FAD-dependent oxidoreductase [Dehalococcoidia bacterium]|nr:FAD-dependent oxidoreductase [Dehalococcoidia bacterium]HIM80492.1 FAD-dependent oxidoreductase [Dehalococcoidia bacterium]
MASLNSKELIRVATDRRDVIVVGGGIIGCLTAYLLSREGLKVTIVEADAVASHASGFAFGGLGPLEGAGIPDPLLGFSVWCLERHATLSPELEEASGVDTQFHLRDRLILAFDDSEALRYKEEIKWQKDVKGFHVEWLDQADVLKVEPRANPACLGASYAQGTGAIEAYRYNLAAAQAAEKFGAEILLRRVTGLISEGGRCSGVTLETGQLEAGAVVLAVGPWSQQASSWCGVEIPVSPLKGQVIRLQLTTDPMRASLNYAGSYAASKPDGLIWAGTTEEEAGFDVGITTAARDKIMGDLLKMAPSLADAELVQQTACLRPISADGLPIVGKVPGWENLYVGTGSGRKGILWSTGMCHGLADLIVKGSTDVPGVSSLDPARFSEG